VEGAASVVAGDLCESGLDVLRGGLSHHAGRLLTLGVDVSQEDAVQLFIRKAFNWSGYCNVLINNAGILRDGVLVKKEDEFVRTLPLAQWQRVLNVNLTGAYLMAREFAAAVMNLSSPQTAIIVNISSISGSGNPGQSNYAASKAGLDACTRTWALELAPVNIRVAGVAPGVIDTPMLRHVSEERRQELLSSIPLRRLGDVADTWTAVRFAIECEFFTGRTVEVDGGASF